jgi:predicted RNase H-like HicB family nuclease
MWSEFLHKKMKTAKYKILRDGTYFGEIPGIRGVWSNAAHLEDCRKELQDVLEEWLFLKVRFGEKVPGLEINTDRRALAKHA